MGDDSIKVSDLLQLQDNITDTIRHEVKVAREEFRDGMHEIRVQQVHDRAAVAALAGRVDRLDERTKLTSRGLLSALPTKTKAALFASAGALVLEGGRHLWALIRAAVSSGVHP